MAAHTQEQVPITAASRAEAVVRMMATQTERARDAVAAQELLKAVQTSGLALTATTLFAAAGRALADVANGSRSSHTTGPVLRMLAACVPEVDALTVLSTMAVLEPVLVRLVQAAPRAPKARLQKSLVNCLIAVHRSVALGCSQLGPQTEQAKQARQHLRTLTRSLLSLRACGEGAEELVTQAYSASFLQMPRGAAQQAVAEAFGSFLLGAIKARASQVTLAQDMVCMGTIFAALADDVSGSVPPGTAPVVADALKSVLLLQSITPAEPVLFTPYCELVASLMGALHSADRALAARMLQPCIDTLAPHLRCPSYGPASDSAHALQRIFDTCIDADMVGAALAVYTAQHPIAANEQTRAAAAPLAQIVHFVRHTLLRFSQRKAWQHSFVAMLGLFRAVGRVPGAAQQLLRGLLCLLCRIHDLPIAELQQELDDIFGGIVQAIGAEQLLACVPLNLDQPLLETDPEALAEEEREHSRGATPDDDFGTHEQDDGANHDWLLPVLARHMARARAPLALFVEPLLPQANALIALSERKEEENLAVEARNLWNRHLSVWQLLPCCCTTPRTVAPSLRKLAPTLGDALRNPTYTVPVATALRDLIDTCTKAANRVLPAASAAAATEEEIKRLQRQAEEVQEAQEALKVLEALSKNFLPCLFNTLSTASSDKVSILLEAIEKYLTVAPPPMRAQYFQVISKQIEANTAASAPAEQQKALTPQQVNTASTMLKLAAAFVPVLDEQSLAEVMAMVMALIQHPERRILKGAWKVLQALCTKHNQLSRQQLYQQLGVVLVNHPPPLYLKKLWLRCVAALAASFIPHIQDDLQQQGYVAAALPQHDVEYKKQALDWLKAVFLPAVLASVILGMKDLNARTRTESYTALPTMAHAFVDLCVVTGAASADAAAQQFTGVLMAGLGGREAHMLSCTVVALSSMLFTFCRTKPRLLSQEFVAAMTNTVLLLLQAAAPEVVRSVLQYMQGLMAVVPPTWVRPLLSPLLKGIVEWTKEHPKHLRHEARVVFEKVLRRYEFDEVAELVPEETRRVLRRIRKNRERKEKKREERKKQEQSLTREEREELRKQRQQHKFERTLDFNDLDSDDDDDEESGEDDEGGRRRYDDDGDDYEDDYEDDDDDDDDEEEEEERGRGRRGMKRRSGDDLEEAFARDDDADDPMDMLSGHPALRNSAASARSSKGAPSAKRRRTERAGRVEMNEDGLIVVEDPEDDEDDQQVLGGRTRAAAAAAAAADESDEEMDQERARSKANAAKGKSEMYQRILERRQRLEEERLDKSKNKKLSANMSGANYKGKGRGDVMRANAPEPFAYVPLDPSTIKKHATASTPANASQFSGFVGTRRKGAERAQERKMQHERQKSRNKRR